MQKREGDGTPSWLTAHANLAAYALGALSDAEEEDFRSHLDTCRRCQAELESVLPVVDLLTDVDHHHLGAPHPDRVHRAPQGHASRLRNAVAAWSHKLRRRRPSTTGTAPGHAPGQPVAGTPAAISEADIAAALTRIDAAAVRVFTALDGLGRRLGPPPPSTGEAHK